MRLLLVAFKVRFEFGTEFFCHSVYQIFVRRFDTLFKAGLVSEPQVLKHFYLLTAAFRQLLERVMKADRVDIQDPLQPLGVVNSDACRLQRLYVNTVLLRWGLGTVAWG